jgi:hypothetical protein
MGRQNEGKVQGVSPATLPTKESVTEHQLVMLLSIINNLGPYLLGLHGPLREFEAPAKIDGGVATSASVTFINACTRLDEILLDKSRWDTAAHDRLYDSIEQVQAAQVQFLHEQAEAARATRLPSFQLRPMIATDGEKFLAVYGDVNKPGHALIGIGATPKEALEDFDRAFDRVPAEQLRIIAEGQGMQFSEKPPENKPKKKKKS